MEYIQLRLDFGDGPVWHKYVDVSTQALITGIDIIDNDPIVAELDEKIQNMYSSFYAFDTENAACEFDEEALRAAAPAMLVDMQKLVMRLNAINDGSFIVEDSITPWLSELANSQS